MATVIYKKYKLIPAGFETIMVASGQGYERPENRMSYKVYRPNGQGIGKAWSMVEGKALVNEDIDERMQGEMKQDDAWVDDMEGMR